MTVQLTDEERATLAAKSKAPTPPLADPLLAADEVAADDGEERLHPLLSNAEVLAARAKAAKKVDAEQHAAAMADVEAKEMARLKYEQGLVTGDGVKDEIISFVLDLPEYCNKLTVNLNQDYYHGQVYKAPRHVVNSLKEMEARAWLHQGQVEGKDIRSRLKYGYSRDTSRASGAELN